MRKLKILLISILFSFVFILPVQADEFSNYELYAENIDISMVVEENGQIHVKTILDMNFLTPHHGIDVQLPSAMI